MNDDGTKAGRWTMQEWEREILGAPVAGHGCDDSVAEPREVSRFAARIYERSKPEQVARITLKAPGANRRAKIAAWYESILRLPDNGARIIICHGSWHEQDATALWCNVERMRTEEEEKEPNGN